MPLAPSLTFENVFGNTYQILCLIQLELEDGVLSRQGEVDDVHRKLLLCVVPISTGGNGRVGDSIPLLTDGQMTISTGDSIISMKERTLIWWLP